MENIVYEGSQFQPRGWIVYSLAHLNDLPIGENESSEKVLALYVSEIRVRLYFSFGNWRLINP